MREIRTSGATRGEVALRVLPYSTVSGAPKRLDGLEGCSRVGLARVQLADSRLTPSYIVKNR